MLVFVFCCFYDQESSSWILPYLSTISSNLLFYVDSGKQPKRSWMRMRKKNLKVLMRYLRRSGKGKLRLVNNWFPGSSVTIVLAVSCPWFFLAFFFYYYCRSGMLSKLPVERPRIMLTFSLWVVTGMLFCCKRFQVFKRILLREW